MNYICPFDCFCNNFTLNLGEAETIGADDRFEERKYKMRERIIGLKALRVRITDCHQFGINSMFT